MCDMTELRGRWALVTGASSGLGADFARELAGRGCNVVLVARREEPMKALAGALESAHAIQTRVVRWISRPERAEGSPLARADDVEWTCSSTRLRRLRSIPRDSLGTERQMIELIVPRSST
jgi:NAD(P)-dependent dehydrogenase (short-subunit alcohol dehydrogenase family)